MSTKRLLALAVAALIVLSVSALLSGCSRPTVPVAPGVQVTPNGDKTTVTTRDEEGGKMTVQSEKRGPDGGKVTINTGKGTTTAETGKDVVTEEKVGVAFYPGATVETGGNWSASGESTGAMSMVALITTDPFDKVAKFYKDKYSKGNTVVEQPNQLIIMMKSGENAGKTIMVAPSDDKTSTKVQITATTTSGG
jgi:hypothetical protein